MLSKDDFRGYFPRMILKDNLQKKNSKLPQLQKKRWDTTTRRDTDLGCQQIWPPKYSEYGLNEMDCIAQQAHAQKRCTCGVWARRGLDVDSACFEQGSPVACIYCRTCMYVWAVY